MSDQYRNVVNGFHQAVFVEHDAKRAVQFYTEDATLWEPLPGEIKGRKAIQEYLESLLQSFPDISAEIRNVFGSNDWFAAELIVRGTNTGPIDLPTGDTISATGRPVELKVCWLGKVSPDGLCVEDRTYYDNASFIEQLGLVSEQQAARA
jgi:hypothetical protein